MFTKLRDLIAPKLEPFNEERPLDSLAVLSRRTYIRTALVVGLALAVSLFYADELDRYAQGIIEDGQRVTGTTPIAAGSHPVTTSTSASALQTDRSVTLDEFQSVRPGMTYDRVVEIVGFEGEAVSPETTGTSQTATYQWRNMLGSSMSATFEDGKLTEKTQDGLD